MRLIARPAAIRVHSAVISSALQISIWGKDAERAPPEMRERGGLTLAVTYINVLKSNKKNISLSACTAKQSEWLSLIVYIFIACSLCM